MTPFPTGLAVLEYELMAEQASALGHSGRAAQAALARLAERDGQGTKTEIERLVDNAAQGVWSLFIQREACGMSNSRDVIEQYGIPDKVLARLGAAPRHNGPLKMGCGRAERTPSVSGDLGATTSLDTDEGRKLSRPVSASGSGAALPMTAVGPLRTCRQDIGEAGTRNMDHCGGRCPPQKADTANKAVCVEFKPKPADK